jgi:arginyl-tRNA synthetase
MAGRAQRAGCASRVHRPLKPQEVLEPALRRAAAAIGASADLPFALGPTRDPAHGDFATNLALVLAKSLGRKPREVADALVAKLELAPGFVEKIEIAGPGFINFFLQGGQLAQVIRDVLARGQDYGRATVGAGRKVNVEFVSANPTGPLHVGHGRGAALGDAIATVLDWTGWDVTREFYVNDAGNQIDKLAQSLWARIQQQVGRHAGIPEGGYQGQYLVELAEGVLAREGKSFADLPEALGLQRCRTIGVMSQRAEQDVDLRDFGVRFDVVCAESTLYTQGLVERTLQALERAGHVFEQDGALWLRTTTFGDDQDRVLRKRDGTYTYFMPDIAYHRDKRERGFARAIDVWGADHHGYAPRMRAAMIALGYPEDFFHAEIVQLVRVMRGGTEVRFSKRAGDFVTLRELFEDAGIDAARYFFLMRRGDGQFTFDVDLARSQTEDNPVYYVQMAHARLSGIFRVAGRAPESVTADGADLAALEQPEEVELLKQVRAFPDVVARAADTLEPHRITGFLEGLARVVHAWYHKFRVLGEPEELPRLVLARATRQVLANGLTILGIRAPDRM